MGYKPGMGLGASGTGITAPIEESVHKGRRGLGYDLEGLEKNDVQWELEEVGQVKIILLYHHLSIPSIHPIYPSIHHLSIPSIYPFIIYPSHLSIHTSSIHPYIIYPSIHHLSIPSIYQINYEQQPVWMPPCSKDVLTEDDMVGWLAFGKVMKSHLYVCMYLYTYVRMYIYVYVSMYVFMYLCMYLHVCSMYIHICTYVVCIYIHVCVHM